MDRNSKSAKKAQEKQVDLDLKNCCAARSKIVGLKMGTNSTPNLLFRVQSTQPKTFDRLEAVVHQGAVLSADGLDLEVASHPFHQVGGHNPVQGVAARALDQIHLEDLAEVAREDRTQVLEVGLSLAAVHRQEAFHGDRNLDLEVGRVRRMAFDHPEVVDLQSQDRVDQLEEGLDGDRNLVREVGLVQVLEAEAHH